MEYLLSRPLDELPLLFCDLETTGLDLSAGHRICEIALLRVCGERIEGQLEALVNPGRAIDPPAAAVNGLRDELLVTAPVFATLSPQIEQLLAGAVLVAHNLPFDLAFLQAELNRLGRPGPAGPTLDTLALARRLIRRPSYSLGALAVAFDLPPPTHRAMADLITLRQLFAQLRQLLAAQGITTLGAALRFERGLLPDMPEPEPPPLLALALAEGRLLRIRYRSRSSPEPIERAIRPLYLTRETSGVFLRAFCYLRRDVRAFALEKISAMTLIEEPSA